MTYNLNRVECMLVFVVQVLSKKSMVPGLVQLGQCEDEDMPWS